MATTFSAALYRVGLQELLDRHDVPVTVKAFEPEHAWEKLQGAVAELVIEQAATSQTGDLRELDVVLNAGLLVLRKLNEHEAEENAFELALEVAVHLVDEVDPDGVPVFAGGPILVTSIEPEALEGALQHRVVAYLVRFEHAFRVRSANEDAEPEPPSAAYLGRAPNVGTGHEGDYKQIFPKE